MNKANRTISFTSAPTEVEEGATITVSASPSAGSGDGTIIFSSSNTSIATVSGSTITGVAEGSVTIYASIAEGTNYLSASTSYALIVVSAVIIDLSMVDNEGNKRASRTTANCYMVHDAGKYNLPLVYGNAIKNGNEASTAAFYTSNTSNTLQRLVNHAGQGIVAPWIKDNTTDGSTPIVVDGAELVWEDQVGLVTNISIDDDYLKFKVPADASTKEGNAVIAAKMGSTIVWSWHIWVTTETYANLTTINTGAHTYQVAPVNVGEANGGSTYYQWGRKDAMPTGLNWYDASHTARSSFTTASSGTIADNIKNPLTWYNVSNKPHDGTKYNYWDMANTSLSNNRSNATVKTIYDPCPPGFCVPTSNLYNYMSSNSGSTTWTSDATFKGRTWTAGGANLKFPAAGCRNDSDGSLIDVSGSGYYWLAAPGSASNGHNLFFNSSNWNLVSRRRSRGFSVRPVVEE